MPVLNFRDAEEFDPETYGGEGSGGLLGRLQAIVQPGQVQPGIDSRATSNGALEFNPGSYDSPQDGLFGRLLAIQMQQSQVGPGAELNPQIPVNNGQNLTVQQTLDHGQTPLTRIVVRPSNAYSAYDPKAGTLPPVGFPVPQAEASTQPEAIQQDETDHALARGVRNLTPNQGAPLDPIDIAKSAGIGLANGVVNAAGLPGGILTGFGYFPNNLVVNGLRRAAGYPDLSADAPDWIRDTLTAEPIRHWIEGNTAEFYQPKSRAGRYAETIGEMMPMGLGGEAVGVIRGAQTARTALSALPETLAKHAVAPGVAVQALEEALPDSQVGQTLQKVYPVIRRGLPAALAATRYLTRRVVSQ
jgi:hypothetical protein